MLFDDCKRGRIGRTARALLGKPAVAPENPDGKVDRIFRHALFSMATAKTGIGWQAARVGKKDRLMNDDLVQLLWCQAWQVTVVILCVGLVTHLVARNRPWLAHGLWLVVLVKCITPPLWSSPSSVFSWWNADDSQQSQNTANGIDTQTRHAVGSSLDATGQRRASDRNATQTLPTRLQRLVLSDADFPESAGRPATAAELQVLESSSDAPAILPGTGIQKPSAENSPTAAADGSWTSSHWLMGIWLAGVLFTVCWWLLQWCRCLRELNASTKVTDAVAEQLLVDLQQQLGLRRKVRLVISTSSLGPAVIGLFRPVILLPAQFATKRSPENLKPVLTHELLHVRRGDLWIGALQLVVQAVWWFHPLVWLVNRWLTREAERCCDEQVLAETGCKPATYAHTLLNVLELKHQLQSVPSFPGMKAVEVTTRRLERIMQLEHGCRKRTPWHCLVVMLIVAGVLLPGAGLEAGKKRRARKAKQQADAAAKESTPNALPPLKATHGMVIHTYTVRDTLKKLAPFVSNSDDKGEANAAAREVLLKQLQPLLVNPPAIDPVPAKVYASPAAGDLAAALKVNSEPARCEMTISGSKLFVRAPAAVQQKIAAAIQRLTKDGLSQLRIELQLATCAADLDALRELPWQNMPHQQRRQTDDNTQTKLTSKPRSTTVIERDLPVRYSLLNPTQTWQLLQQLQGDARSNIMASPKLVTNSGQPAEMYSGTQRPFVVGFQENGKPHIRVVNSGITVTVLPTLLDEKSVSLSCVVERGEVKSVETFTLPGTGDATARTVQVPEIVKAIVNAQLELPVDATLVLHGGTFLTGANDKQARQETGLILMRVNRLVPKSDQSSGLIYGQGVNSDAGLTGHMTVDEQNFDIKIAPPTPAEVLKKLDFERPVKGKRTNVRVVNEQIRRLVTPPRHYPLIGVAELHTAQFKCTVYSDVERTQQIGPRPLYFKNTARGSSEDVVYIDKHEIRPVPANRVPANWKEHRAAQPDGRKDTEVAVQLFSRPDGKGVVALPRVMRLVNPQPSGRIVKDHAVQPAAGNAWADSRRVQRQRALNERKIEQTLAKSGSFSVDNVPLDQALRLFSRQHGLNIVLDARGLQEAGVEPEAVVSLKVKDVKIGNILRLLLGQHGLDFVIEDEVIKVSSKAVCRGALLTRVYAVADLVVPITEDAVIDLTGEARPAATPPAWKPRENTDKLPQPRYTPPKPEFEALIDLLTSTISPDLWSEYGGEGSIRAYPQNLSLVVRQREKTHAEIAEILTQLRRLQDTQLTFELRSIELPQYPGNATIKGLRENGFVVLDPKTADEIWTETARDESLKTTAACKVTLFNGQPVTLRIRRGKDQPPANLQMHSVATADRKFIRLQLAPDAKTPLQALARLQQHEIADGGAIVIDTTRLESLPQAIPAGAIMSEFRREQRKHAKGPFQFLMIRPHIIIQEEEEVLNASEPPQKKAPVEEKPVEEPAAIRVHGSPI